ncbi:MAG: hypothetical protein M1826_002326 [Phylliscum demangeonii]|nr:MAG: hypothetical protein M1826_002326 [Phylliscum demangeonii]
MTRIGSSRLSDCASISIGADETSLTFPSLQPPASSVAAGMKATWASCPCQSAVHLLLLLPYGLARLVPVRLRADTPKLGARVTPSPTSLLRPRPEVRLAYAEQVQHARPYLVRVTLRHDERPYVMLDELDDVLHAVRCSRPLAPPSSDATMLLSFKRPDGLVMAEEHWSSSPPLTFITHHASCNDHLDHPDHLEPAAFRSSTVTFDHEAATALVRGAFLPFGPESDASTSIAFAGGTASAEEAARLELRSLAKLHAPPSPIASHVFAFAHVRAGARDLLQLPLVNVQCVDCSVVGELTVSFDVAFARGNVIDAIPSLIHAASPQHLLERLVQKMELSVETNREIQATMNYRVKSRGAVVFGYPALVPATGQPGVEDKLPASGQITLFKFHQWSITASASFGLTVGVRMAAGVDFSYPVVTTIAAGQQTTVNLVPPGATRNTIRPRIRAGPAHVETVQGSACFTANYGPAVALSVEAATSAGTKLSLVVAVGIDAPRLQTCLSAADAVGESCNPGPILNGIREKTTLAVGLYAGASFVATIAGKPVPRLPAFNIHIDPALHPSVTLDDRCYALAPSVSSSATALSFDAMPPATAPSFHTVSPPTPRPTAPPSL